MKPKILVIGENSVTPMGIIRALGQKGYDIDVVYFTKPDNKSDVIKSCRYVNRVTDIPKTETYRFYDVIKKDYADGNWFLFPSCDLSAELISKIDDETKKHVYMQYSKSYSIPSLLEKNLQNKLAGECGLKTPNEVVVSLSDENPAIPNSVTYPCFVKPLVSATGNKTEMAVCGNSEELRKHLAKIRKTDSNRKVLVQDYLNITKEYTIGGVCTENEVYIPGIIKKKVIARLNKGVTLMGEIVPNSEIGENYALVEAFLKKTGFVGMFDLELMITDNGCYFGELNLRAGGPSYAYTYLGCNLPDFTVRSIMDNSEPVPKDKPQQGKFFVNPKVLFEDYRSLLISSKEFKEILSGSDFNLLTDKSDPEPEKVFMSQVKNKVQYKRFKRFVKNTLIRAGLLHK
ncbi:MAG: ATP-grasp domain-containing protein [Clostridia bacterium]|nr:ATP-grasp domain-containing protein [Clostridia bacterium]